MEIIAFFFHHPRREHLRKQTALDLRPRNKSGGGLLCPLTRRRGSRFCVRPNEKTTELGDPRRGAPDPLVAGWAPLHRNFSNLSANSSEVTAAAVAREVPSTIAELSSLWAKSLCPTLGQSKVVRTDNVLIRVTRFTAR